MKKKAWIWIVMLIASLAIIYLIVSIILAQSKSRSDVTEFAPYISAYTSGVISKSSPIKIQLTDDFAKTLPEIEERPVDLFDISPGIDGNAGWIDYRTIQFTPDKNLESDKSYTIRFELVGLDHSMDRQLRVFIYTIKTKPQNYSVDVTEIITTDKKELKWQEVHGRIRTADTEDIENIEKMLDVRYDDRSLNTKIIQTDNRLFEFRIDSVPRKEKSGRLNIHYEGEAIGVDKKGSMDINIPSISEFLVLDVDVVQSPDQYVKVQFSDPIQENQYLDGLINLENGGMLNFSVQDNIIKIYPEERLKGQHRLSINSGIKNILGYAFKKQYYKELDFVEILPAVRMAGEGTIMPKGNGQLTLPFEAVNLKAVDVRISKIYENNILQFLQVNDIDDNYQLKRVSNVVKTKTVNLNQTDVTDLGKWNRYHLELNELLNTDPGAIYRVDIGFRMQHAIYPCDEKETDGDKLTSIATEEEEQAFWDNFENYYYNSNYSDWEHRDDPCHPAYYGFKRAVSRNVFASNIGLTGKKGNDGSVLLIVNDLLSTEPLQEAEVDLYDYQQQLIESKTTDRSGVAEFDLSEEQDAYFAVATKGDTKAYLKMNDGNSLSISDFDVGGTNVRDGLKGFIYTERGVRRPGDSIYVGFILEDIHDKLPIGHPVVFELYNPKSQQIDRQVQNLDELRFHAFRSATDPDAVTGNYSVRISLGGKTFYHQLPVETIKPNRLKIDFTLEDGCLYAGKSNPVELQVNWLHGAVAKNLKTTVAMSLYRSNTSFSNYEDYHFDDITSDFSYNTTEILNTTTGNQGHISANISPDKLEHAPGKLIANLTIKAFEKGGNFSIKEQQAPFHPFSTYTGMKLPASNRSHGNYLPTDKTHTVDIVTLDTEGRKISKSHNLQIELLKSEWSWWYYSYNNNSNYTSSDKIKIIDRETIHTSNGQASWDFEVDRDNWGYYILKITDMDSGHTTAQRIYADWPEYAGIGRNKAKSANILQFRTEKDTFNVDEEIKIKLPGSENGRAFISVENGSRVIDHYWLETDKGETEFTFLASEEMTPNVYIHISLLQPHEQTDNDRPIRMYGVIPVHIINKETHLKPVLDMPDKLKAESEFEIEVSEANKKDMSYTIAIVDEGLLSLTNFETPDPWDYFYAREALGVKTWDMYDWVIGAYGSKVERLLSIGGGGSLNKESARKANRFEPVVKFIGPFHLRGGQSTTHKIRLPRYVGSVRTMLVAGNTSGAYGNAEKTTTVTKPLMVLGDMPRVLGPGESLDLPVNVFAMEKHVKKVRIEVSTNDLLKIDGEAKKTINFDKPGEKIISFPILVQDKSGIARVEIQAFSGNEKSAYDIEIDVRHPNPPMTSTEGIDLNAEETKNITFDQFGMPETSKASIEVYGIPPINLQKRINYLLRYPHACLEQVVSAAFPQLYLHRFTNLTEEQKAESKDNVETAIEKLRKYQMSNGGFSYWPGGQNTNQWVTSYTGHFMLEARKQGYDISDAMLNNWKKYQKERAVKWTDEGATSQFVQSYRLYTLALAGKSGLSAMNRLKQSENLSEKASWRLAAAYELAGKHKTAVALITNLDADVDSYRYGPVFGSSVRDEAMMLETLVLIEDKKAAFDVLGSLADELGTDKWMSTQTTAWALMATAAYIDAFDVAENIDCSYSLNGAAKANIQSEEPMIRMPLKDLRQKDNEINLTNNTDGMLFVRIVQDGIPATGSETASENKLIMDINYLYPDGSKLNPMEIEQGTDFICEVKISHDSYEASFTELALTQIFPSGWEIINSRLFSTELGNVSSFDYQDIRDDRICTYFDLGKGKTRTYRVMLNASYAGDYYLPAFEAEAMYNKSIHARNRGQWVKVVKP